MEHPCPKCGAAVEDGVPFCRVCRAPQIRVVGVEPDAWAQTKAEGHEESGSGLPPVAAVLAQAPPLPHGVKWSQALPSAALGGAFSLLLSVIPFAVLGPAFLAGGALAVFLYWRRTKSELSRSEGAQVGAASGGFGFLFFAVPTLATVVYRPDELRQAMAAQVEARHYDPEVTRQIMQILSTPRGLTFFVAFVLVVVLLIFVAGGSIGGAWYSAWLRKRSGG